MPPAVSPLLDALYHGNNDEAQRLLAATDQDRLTVHEAAAMGVVERLKALLQEDPRLVNAWSDDGFQPLGLACFFGRREAAELLLSRGGDVNTPARHQLHVTALHAALAGPEPGIGALVIAAGADVNARQQDGVTPLHEAAFVGLADLTRLLLEHGADPNARGADGKTPGDLARERGHTDVANMLP